MESDKLITFIIPTIGRLSLLKTIESLKNQKIDKWNCIILFDGIKNNIIKNNIDNRIKIIELENKIGEYPNYAGNVRNYAFQYVNTSWIGFIDDDDTISPYYINNLLEEIKINNNMECCIFRMIYKNLIFLPKIENQDIIKNNVGISFCFKKSLFTKIKNLNFINNSHEDYYFLKKIKNNNIEIILSPFINYFVKTEFIQSVNNIKNIPRYTIKKKINKYDSDSDSNSDSDYNSNSDLESNLQSELFYQNNEEFESNYLNQSNLTNELNLRNESNENYIEKIVINKQTLQENRREIMHLLKLEKQKYLKNFEERIKEENEILNIIKNKIIDKKNNIENENINFKDKKNNNENENENQNEIIFEKIEEKDIIEKLDLVNYDIIEKNKIYFNSVKNEKKIFIEVDGGLGNLLFQIYFIFNYSMLNKKNIIFYSKNKNSKFRKDITKYQLFSGFKNYVIHDNKIIENMYDLLNSKNLIYYQEKNLNTDKRINNFFESNQNKDIFFNGYFQSIFYIDLNFNNINEFMDFSMKKVAEVILDKWKEDNNFQNKKIIGIHIRGSDYLKFTKIYTKLTDIYYNNAISKLIEQDNYNLNNIEFIIFTDDIDYVKSSFEFIYKRKYYFVQDIINEYNKKNLYYNYQDEIELFFMSLLNSQISANSTFSLWSSYFGNHDHVYIPSKWFGIKGPDIQIQQFLLKQKKYKLI